MSEAASISAEIESSKQAHLTADGVDIQSIEKNHEEWARLPGNYWVIAQYCGSQVNERGQITIGCACLLKNAVHPVFHEFTVRDAAHISIEDPSDGILLPHMNQATAYFSLEHMEQEPCSVLRAGIYEQIDRLLTVEMHGRFRPAQDVLDRVQDEQGLNPDQRAAIEALAQVVEVGHNLQFAPVDMSLMTHPILEKLQSLGICVNW